MIKNSSTFGLFPSPFDPAANEPEGHCKEEEEQTLVQSIPKELEVAAVEIDQKKQDAKVSRNIIFVPDAHVKGDERSYTEYHAIDDDVRLPDCIPGFQIIEVAKDGDTPKSCKEDDKTENISDAGTKLEA